MIQTQQVMQGQDIKSAMLQYIKATNILKHCKFSQASTEEELAEMYFSKRQDMIEKFSHARNPQVLLHNYQRHSFMYAQGQYSLGDRSHSKKSTIPMASKELIKYQRMEPKNLIIETVHQFFCLEVKLQFDSFGGQTEFQGYHLMSMDMKSKQNDFSNAVAISVYNLHKIYDQSFYKKGQKLILLDPYFRFGNDCSPFVKIESKKQIIFLDDTQSLDDLQKNEYSKLSPIEIKTLGNEQFQEDNFQAAINLYTLGIKMEFDDSSLRGILFGNRCQCFLEIKKYQEALFDANQSLNFSAENTQYQLRRAKALANLNQEQAAIDILSSLEQNKDTLQNLEDFQELQKQKGGKFSFQKLMKQYDDASEKDKYNLDGQEYVGPIEIKLIEGKGRGMYATENIQPGQLVLAEKAFSLNIRRQEPNFELELGMMCMNVPSRNALIRNTQIEMLNSQKKAAQFLKLYNGQNGKQKVLIEELKGLDQDQKILGQSDEEFNFEQVVKVINFNCLSVHPINEHLDLIYNSSVLKDKVEKVGLYLKFSFFNHSCFENTSKFQIGNWLFMVASRLIKCGDELTTMYFPTDLGSSKKKQQLKSYEFECKCEICTNYKNLDNETKKLLIKLELEYKNEDSNIKNIQRKEQLFIEIYPQVIKGIHPYNYYIPEVSTLQRELMCTYCGSKNLNKFTEIWDSYKIHVKYISDVLRIRKDVYQAFGEDSKIGVDVSKICRQVFELTYGSNEQLQKYFYKKRKA